MTVPPLSRSRWLGPAFRPPARRLVSLVPSLTLAVFDLGAGPLLVGRTRFCTEPRPQVEQVATIGGTKNVHVDEVTALAPDVVLANREENTRERVEALASRVPVWLSDPRGPEDVPALWRELGAICRRSGTAERRAREVEAALERVGADRPATPPGFVYWVWREPWMAAGHDTYISRLLTAAGWRNVLAADLTRYPRVDPPAALAWGPAAMLFPDEPYAFSLPSHLGTFGGPARRAGNGWRLASGALTLPVDGRLLGWYPSYTAQGLAYARDLRGRLRGA